jgi:hypothetical protein
VRGVREPGHPPIDAAARTVLAAAYAPTVGPDQLDRRLRERLDASALGPLPRLGASLAGPPHSVETDAGCSRVGCLGGEEHA